MQELIKTTREVGTSAGVLLPREMLGAVVKITVIRKAPHFLVDTLKILEQYNLNKETQGIYLIGSYARKDNSVDSDIDILIITENTTKSIKKGQYSLTLVSEKDLETSLKKNPIIYYPMIAESQPLLNKQLLEKYKDKNLLKNTKQFLRETKEQIKKYKEMISLDEKLKNTNTNDWVAYSLILRLRGIYLLDCLKKNKNYSKKNFLKLIDASIYKRYLYAKDKNKYPNKTSIKNAKEMIELLEKWLKEKKD